VNATTGAPASSTTPLWARPRKATIGLPEAFSASE
jgi:hypothetical protein